MNADDRPARLHPPGLPGDPRDAEDGGPALRSRPLFILRVDLLPKRCLGRTPLGTRWLISIAGGRLDGRVGGILLPGGGDCTLQDTEGGLRLDLRAAAELEDDALLYLAAQGRAALVPAARPADRRAAVGFDPAHTRLRLAPLFETASRRYGWLNRTLAVGVGRLTPSGAVCEVHEIL